MIAGSWRISSYQWSTSHGAWPCSALPPPSTPPGWALPSSGTSSSTRMVRVLPHIPTCLQSINSYIFFYGNRKILPKLTTLCAIKQFCGTAWHVSMVRILSYILVSMCNWSIIWCILVCTWWESSQYFNLPLQSIKLYKLWRGGELPQSASLHSSGNISLESHDQEQELADHSNT